MKIFTKVALISIVALSAIAEPTVSKDNFTKRSIKEVHEKFPGDYFLIHKNIPHYMRIFGNYENDPALSLSETQKKELQMLREKVVIYVSELALKIKEMELRVQKQLIFENRSALKLEPLVNEIAKLRAELTLAHIDCIEKVKSIITEKQHQFFLDKLGIKE